MPFYNKMKKKPDPQEEEKKPASETPEVPKPKEEDKPKPFTKDTPKVRNIATRVKPKKFKGMF